MESVQFETTTSPSMHAIDFLTQMINEETASKGKAYPFAILARDES